MGWTLAVIVRLPLGRRLGDKVRLLMCRPLGISARISKVGAPRPRVRVPTAWPIGVRVSVCIKTAFLYCLLPLLRSCFYLTPGCRSLS